VKYPGTDDKGFSMVSTGVNGFGRFGLHLLKYWLDHRQSASFTIDFINDDSLTIQAAYAIINSDKFVRILDSYSVNVSGDTLSFEDGAGFRHSILFSNIEKGQIPWLGKPQLMLECSGKYCSATINRADLLGETKKVIISASVADADQTIVVGFNHHEYDHKVQIYSYGSCIINAFVPLTDWLHQNYKIQDCDTAVIHNIPEYKLRQSGGNVLQRRSCSLESMGPKLLDYLNPDNFMVLKTYVPYPGISMIDMRYRLVAPPDTIDRLKGELQEAFESGPLNTLYSFDEPGQTSENHLNSTFSAILRRDGLRFVGSNLYISCYFDNENSVNRYYDLVNIVATYPL
jgi:glyceraldehyde 3-phosphate dehydrogenase